MLVKMYKPDGVRRLYWQAWDRDGQAVFYTGELGQRGATEQVAPAAGQSVESVIEAGAVAARRQGFEPVHPGAMRQIVLSCPTGPDWTADDILGVTRYLEELCNDCLGRTGLGHCDGPYYGVGTGSVGVFSLVVDLELGIREVIAELRRHGCDGKDEELVLSVPDGAGFRVVYSTGPRSGTNPLSCPPTDLAAGC